MNDQYNRSWPGQEPDEPRRAQWPANEEPRWPGANEQPPRGPRRPGPQWPGGEEPRAPRRPDPERTQQRPDPDRTQQRRVPPAGRRTPPRQPGPPQGGPPPERPARGYRPPPQVEPEPSLLTHTELNGMGYPDDDYGSGPIEAATEFTDSGPGDSTGADGGTDGDPELTPRQRKKRRWRRIRRVLYVLAGVGVVVPAAAFTIAYFLVDVPTPDQVLADQSQAVTYYYADNSVMGKDIPDTGNRQILQPGQIPEVMKHAAYAAEDATFETNNGFDLVGIFRAVYNNLTGGTGGGSTISQEYIKKATGNEAPTLTRKATELVKSFKLNQTESKEEIIAGYLNIVYFGRNAYGVQAAAHAYFNKDAAQLTPSEASLLAGLIQGPSKSENTEYTTWRWNYVMDNMVKYGWLNPADRKAATYPTPQPKSQARAQAITGPAEFIQQQVEDELSDAGITKEKLQAGGYNVYTTIDPNAQKMAEQAVHDVMNGQPAQLKNAFVAVDPKTRGVIAYYGGPNTDADQHQDWANYQSNPGSSFKAFDLVAFLKLGKGLGETFDGTTHRQFGQLPDGEPHYVNNAGVSNSCSQQCTVAEATMRSTNTVFYDMVVNVTKVQGVIDAAKEAGITVLNRDHQNLDFNISIGGGTTLVKPLDMAAAYATFADNGLAQPSHFVAKVTDPAGNIVYQPPTDTKPAFDPSMDKSRQIAGNVTDALKPVINFSHLTCPQGHECAGKTGTQQYVESDPSKPSSGNAQVWMVGYTPSVSAASWVGTNGNRKLLDKNGKNVSSDGLPAQIWQEFMNNYLKGKPPEKFPSVSPIGKTPEEASASMSPSTTTPPPATTTTTPPATTSTTSSSQSETSSTSSSSRRGGILGPGPGGFGGD